MKLPLLVAPGAMSLTAPASVSPDPVTETMDPPLSSGSASLNVSTLSVGSHTITSVYSGGGAFVGVATDPITHVVAKGDNPASIAKKFKVSYDELLALNHIDDPKKLKIGQKVLIPSKGVKGKKGEE